MKSVLSLLLALAFTVSGSDLSAAHKKVGKSKEKSHEIKNVEPSESKKIIVSINETDRKIVEMYDGDGWVSREWEELHISQNIQFDDGTKAKLTIVIKKDIEKMFNSFYLETGDEIQFGLYTDRMHWNADIGNLLELTVSHKGVSIGKFQGFYLIPGANMSWSW